MNAAATEYKGLVLAIHPTSRGFGWVLFESPLSAVDWGIASARRSRGIHLAARFERLLKRYEPAVLVLEEFEERQSNADWIRLLCRRMIHRAAGVDMDTLVFRRTIIRAVFANLGARTRYEIAQTIAQHVDAFSHRLPRKRKPWEGDDPRQSIFDAASLAITYFAVTTPLG